MQSHTLGRRNDALGDSTKLDHEKLSKTHLGYDQGIRSNKCLSDPIEAHVHGPHVWRGVARDLDSGTALQIGDRSHGPQTEKDSRTPARNAAYLTVSTQRSHRAEDPRRAIHPRSRPKATAARTRAGRPDPALFPNFPTDRRVDGPRRRIDSRDPELRSEEPRWKAYVWKTSNVP